MMIQEPISCRAYNALTARCESLAALRAPFFKRPVFNLAAYVDNREFKHDVCSKRQTAKINVLPSAFSRLYTPVKIFTFSVNRRFFPIFLLVLFKN